MTFVTETYRPKLSLRERFSLAMNNYRERRAQEREYRKTLNELNRLTDRELSDIGIGRSMIEDIARQAACEAN